MVYDKSSRNKVLTEVEFMHQTLFGDMSSLSLRKWAEVIFISLSLVVGNVDIEHLKIWTKENRLSKRGPCLAIVDIYKCY